MQTVLLAVHLVVAVLLIGLVMLQKSEGGALGIGGSNSGGNLFSARGVGNTLTRATAILATAFFATSIALTMLANHKTTGSIVDSVPVQSAPASGSSAVGTPSAPAPADAGGSHLPQLDQKPAVPTNQ